MSTVRLRKYNRDLLNLLTDIFEDVFTPEQRAKFDPLIANLRFEHEDSLSITDRRSVAWTEARRAENGAKVSEAAKIRHSMFTHLVTVSNGQTSTSSVVGVFAIDEVKTLAQALGLAETTVQLRLGSIRNTTLAEAGKISPCSFTVSLAVGTEHLYFNIMRVSIEYIERVYTSLVRISADGGSGEPNHMVYEPGSNLADLYLDTTGNNAFINTGSERQRQARRRAARAQAAVASGERQPSASPEPAKTARKPRAMKNPVSNGGAK